jgi:radical SAM superfamily enzyme YgiQ (UPF0313 family)
MLQKQEINILWNCQSRVTSIDETVIKEMKRAGCECIQLGIESGSPRILQQLGKKTTPAQIDTACTLISKVGINLSIYLISDVPGETSDDILQTIKLVRHIHPDHGYISPLAYYPGTRLYKDAVAAGSITPDIFSDTRKAALYVVSTPGHASSRLLKELAKQQHNDPERFKQQKKYLGFCYTTNIIAGEWYRQRGQYKDAEKELREITVLQPHNPWGWYLLGDLYSELGNARKGEEFYIKALTIVPRHGPSIAAQSAK